MLLAISVLDYSVNVQTTSLGVFCQVPIIHTLDSYSAFPSADFSVDVWQNTGETGVAIGMYITASISIIN